jgi:hypothetical protein
LAFRDAVIAGLRARGWPEHGLDDRDNIVWRGADGVVCLRRDEVIVTYEVDAEHAAIVFEGGAVPERVTLAIDRLRWVIGLPARVGPGNLAGCLPEPVPLIPPAGAAEALAAAREHGLDPDGPPLGEPLRSRPAKEDPAYVPTRWIGE